MELNVVKTKNGYLISDTDIGSSYPYSTLLHTHKVNGELTKPTFNKQWVLTPNFPENIEVERTQQPTNYRYELKTPELCSDKIPMILTREEHSEYDDEECYWSLKHPWSEYSSLYESLSDPQPNIWVDVPFEILSEIEVDEVKDEESFSYTVQKTQWSHQGTTEITEKDSKHQLIDMIVFPSIILPNKPCRLTSRETYKIVRYHIQNNIDPKVAKITSDYDFCFVVKKKVKLVVPKTWRVDVGKRKPKYIQKSTDHKEVEIFEMTYKEKSFSDHTPIKSFEGTSQTDLKNQIDEYLSSLMDYINEPVSQCPTCVGVGNIVKTKHEREV